MTHMPLILDLSDRSVVIFGGGAVGERKARLFSQFTQVKVVSIDFTPGLRELEGVELVKALVDPANIDTYLKDMFIAIPATNDKELNDVIETCAQRQGILVNRVDDRGDLIVPSVIRRGPVVIGISTLGHSPALSKYIRLKLEEVVGEECEGMARLQNTLREELKIRVESEDKRREILWAVLNDEEIWLALRESYEKAYNIALRYMYELENGTLG